MEMQLQELINQIKEDGVKVAESEADAIVNAAKEEDGAFERRCNPSGRKKSFNLF